MIDKETAIELAKEAGGLLTEFGINCTKGMRFHNLDTLTSLCNLAYAAGRDSMKAECVKVCEEQHGFYGVAPAESIRKLI